MKSRATRPYPVALDLKDRPCLVVGGGAVARRKVEGLLESGAAVTVVAPRFCRRLEDLEFDGKISLQQRAFSGDDVRGMTLVFACSDSPEVNAAAGVAARKARALFNRADDPGDCDFAGMSQVARGRLLVAISTGSESPAFARWVREQLERQLGPEYGVFLDLVSTLREEVKDQVDPADRGAAWERALHSDAFDLVRSGKVEEAKRELRRVLLTELPDSSRES